MESKVKKVKNQVNKNAVAPEPNHNSDQSQDLINPVVSPDDDQDLGSSASAPVKQAKPPMAQGDPTKLKSMSLPIVKEDEIQVDFSKDLQSVFEEQDFDLSDDFYRKLSNLLEAAVRTKVREIAEDLQVSYEEALTEEVFSIKEELEERVDNFLTTTCEEWQAENQLAIEYGVRNELTESFISGLKNLFETHYIEVPEARYDVVEDLEYALDDLKEDFSKLYEDNVTLKEYTDILQYEMDKVQKEHLLFVESQDLTDTEKEKFFALTENLMKEDFDYFESKVSTIKENHFPKYQVNYLTEDLDETEYVDNNNIDPTIAQIAARLF